MLEVIKLTKFFGGIAALMNVSFKLENNRIVSIIGPNGAGKTTLFNLIGGYFRPDSGHILFNGEEITGWQPNAICKKGLTRTFQIVKPFTNLTILQNVTIGALKWAQSITEGGEYSLHILEKVGLIDRKDDFTGSLTLEGKKRLELARTLATRPVVLMLDEVMGGLNQVEIREIVDLIRRIQSEDKITFLIVEHVLNVVMELSEKIIVLNQGEKIAEGTPEEISRDQKTIEAYIGRKRVAHSE
jgi:branched-chain amino acid transport system ATP-binding protein